MDNEKMLRAEFETTIGAKELMAFKVYHNYHSVSGIASLLFGIIALIICVVSVNQVNVSYTLMMGFFGVFFTIYTPIGMYLKVRKQAKKIQTSAEPVKYVVTEEKIELSQGEIKEELLWDDIYAIKCTGKNLVLYVTSIRANIIPLANIGDEATEFFEIAVKKLRPFQIKVKVDKIIEKCKG